MLVDIGEFVQNVFTSYSDRAVHFMELPGEIPNRQVLRCIFSFGSY